VRFGATRAPDHAHANGSGASDTERFGLGARGIELERQWPWQRQTTAASLPRIGAEVLIDFLGGDPDRPIIVGQLYNAVGAPPGLSSAAPCPATVICPACAAAKYAVGAATSCALTIRHRRSAPSWPATRRPRS
jgi:hypothetical protein